MLLAMKMRVALVLCLLVPGMAFGQAPGPARVGVCVGFLLPDSTSRSTKVRATGTGF